MNWSELNEFITKNDGSPELKKGQIKGILIDTAKKISPEFQFLSYRNGGYIFQRLRQINDLTIYETLSVLFSLKDRNFDCSVASRLNPEYIFDRSYNLGFLNPNNCLGDLKNIPGKGGWYFHNGRLKITTETVVEIFQDFKKYGLPFLDRQFENLRANEIIRLGFEYINNMKTDKELLKEELNDELIKGRHLFSNIHHPIYLDLKGKLISIMALNEGDKRYIPKAAYEFLEIYWTVKKTM